MSSTQPDLSTLGSDAQPEHIRRASEDAKKAIEKRIKQKKDEAEAEKEQADPKIQEEYPFSFSFEDGRGRKWKGSFTNKILTHADRQVIGALQADWQLGKPYSAFDTLTQEINFILAHMTVSLKPGPDAAWAKDLRDLKSVELIQALYEEVASHEAMFHGRGTDQERSQADD